jgi:hypothetical protein
MPADGDVDIAGAHIARNHVVDTNQQVLAMRMTDLEGKHAKGQIKKGDTLAHLAYCKDWSRGHNFSDSGAVLTRRDPKTDGQIIGMDGKIGGSGTMKSDYGKAEEVRRHRFDDWGSGAVMTGRSVMGNTSTTKPRQEPVYNYARQMGIKRSFPKYTWSEMGSLITERRDDFKIQFTDRSTERGAYMSARGGHKDVSMTARTDQSESMEELEAKRADMQARLEQIEALLNAPQTQRSSRTSRKSRR